MSKIMVVLSGGQDSTTCLFIARCLFVEVHAVTFDYHQRHDREIQAAKRIAYLAGVTSHEVVDLGPILKGDSPLVNVHSRLEQYPDGNLPGGLEKTFVPMRNQLFLTVAANRAYVKGIRHLMTGVCQADFGGYPDCRREFIDALQVACNLGTFTGEDGALESLRIHTPLMDKTKAEAVQWASNDKDCWTALAFSHTAYDGAYPPKGSDHATKLREKGFAEAGLADPLMVRAWIEGLVDEPTGSYDPALRSWIREAVSRLSRVGLYPLSHVDL